MVSESGMKGGIIAGAIAIVLLLLITAPGVSTVLGIAGNETTIYAGLIIILVVGMIVITVKGK